VRLGYAALVDGSGAFAACHDSYGTPFIVFIINGLQCRASNLASQPPVRHRRSETRAGLWGLMGGDRAACASCRSRRGRICGEDSALSYQMVHLMYRSTWLVITPLICIVITQTSTNIRFIFAGHPSHTPAPCMNGMLASGWRGRPLSTFITKRTHQAC
jgi:hypothetical protein